MLKFRVTKWFDPGFKKLLTELTKLTSEQQTDMLIGLKQETEVLGGIVTKGEYTEGGDEFGSGRRFEFPYFHQAIFQGESDIRLATNEKSRLYLAKDMTEYPEAWLETVDYMVRKFEHAINNLELLAVGAQKVSYDIKGIFEHVLIIESPSNAVQGTAFYLKGVGLVTCQHCIADQETGEYFDDLVVYKAKNISRKIPVIIKHAHAVIDLAILAYRDDQIDPESGLTIGDSDEVNYQDHIAVAGFTEILVISPAGRSLASGQLAALPGF